MTSDKGIYIYLYHVNMCNTLNQLPTSCFYQKHCEVEIFFTCNIHILYKLISNFSSFSDILDFQKDVLYILTFIKHELICNQIDLGVWMESIETF